MLFEGLKKKLLALKKKKNTHTPDAKKKKKKKKRKVSVWCIGDKENEKLHENRETLPVFWLMLSLCRLLRYGST